MRISRIALRSTSSWHDCDHCWVLVLNAMNASLSKRPDCGLVCDTRLPEDYTTLEPCHGGKLPQLPHQTDQIDLAMIWTKLDDICMFYNKWKQCQIARGQYRQRQSGHPQPEVIQHVYPGAVWDLPCCLVSRKLQNKLRTRPSPFQRAQESLQPFRREG